VTTVHLLGGKNRPGQAIASPTRVMKINRQTLKGSVALSVPHDEGHATENDDNADNNTKDCLGCEAATCPLNRGLNL
jgi:hypothetical protein